MARVIIKRSGRLQVQPAKEAAPVPLGPMPQGQQGQRYAYTYENNEPLSRVPVSGGGPTEMVTIVENPVTLDVDLWWRAAGERDYCDHQIIPRNLIESARSDMSLAGMHRFYFDVISDDANYRF